MSNKTESDKNTWSEFLKLAGIGLVLLFGWWWSRPPKDITNEQLEKTLSRLPTKAPTPDNSHLVTGRTALARNDLDLAITSFTEAIRQDPKCAEAYHLRGTAYGKKGDRVREAADREEAVRLNPDLAKDGPR